MPLRMSRMRSDMYWLPIAWPTTARPCSSGTPARSTIAKVWQKRASPMRWNSPPTMGRRRRMRSHHNRPAGVATQPRTTKVPSTASASSAGHQATKKSDVAISARVCQGSAAPYLANTLSNAGMT